MLNALCPVIVRMAARFENIVKTDDIAFYVHIGICYRIPNARLRRKIYNDIKLIFRKKLVYKPFICNIPFNETPFRRAVFCKFFDFFQTVFFNGNVVVIVEII